MKTILQSIRMLIVLSLLTGLIYPLAMTGLAQLLMPAKANGSFIQKNGQPIGSELIGQSFVSKKYFWSRPSGTGYNPVPSSGTNLGPISATLRDSVASRASRFGSPIAEIPADLLEASGSGLDPHISPEAALYQVNRVMKAREMNSTKLEVFVSLVRRHTELPQWGFLGEPRVNVLLLNLALDSLFE